MPITFEFTGDVEFDLISSLLFFVTHVDAGATVLADFSRTAIINLTVTTLTGDLTADVVIASASGNFRSAAVPVPGWLPLLASALVALAWQVRRGAGRLSHRFARSGTGANAA